MASVLSMVRPFLGDLRFDLNNILLNRHRCQVGCPACVRAPVPPWRGSMLIAQITDLHVRRPDELAYSGEIDTAKRLESAVSFINQFRPGPDLVLATGDLVDYGRP